MRRLYNSATLPTRLVEQGRYEEALQLENTSNEAIKGSEIPITVLCLYKAVPENLEDRFSEYHDLIVKRSAAITSPSYSKVPVRPKG
jgi:hypothetical protein